MSEKQDKRLQTLQTLTLDRDAIGLLTVADDDAYFCTPVGARMIGRVGVDGIHFCDVPQSGRDTVFAVSPMGDAPYVCAVADDLEDFLREVYTCGSAAAVEQLTWMEPRQAADFLRFDRILQISDDPEALRQANLYFGMEADTPIDATFRAQQRQALETLRTAFSLTPISGIYDHVKAVQRSFDIKTLTFSQEYYDLLG